MDKKMKNSKKLKNWLREEILLEQEVKLEEAKLVNLLWWVIMCNYFLHVFICFQN